MGPHQYDKKSSEKALQSEDFSRRELVASPVAESL